MQFDFYVSQKWGLIRKRSSTAASFHPEVWNDGRWVTESPYVMDAITGMGEDPYSCGEFSEPVDSEAAAEHAKEHGIDLFADNPDDPHADAKAD